MLISIGNLSVGGSGKTPMVIALSKILDNLSVSHAVVSRGYKKKSFLWRIYVSLLVMEKHDR